jgi:hypothetical protein
MNELKKLSVLQIIPRILSATIFYLYAACVRRALVRAQAQYVVPILLYFPGGLAYTVQFGRKCIRIVACRSVKLHVSWVEI